MKITFLGGPKHGQHEDLSSSPSPNRIPAIDANGKPVMYEKAFERYKGLGNGVMQPFHASYALVGTSLQERNALSREVGEPPDLL